MITGWSMMALTPGDGIFTLTQSLRLGTMPKQHIDWSRMRRSCVTSPPSTLNGSMKPLMATSVPWSARMLAGMALTPLSPFAASAAAAPS